MQFKDQHCEFFCAINTIILHYFINYIIFTPTSIKNIGGTIYLTDLISVIEFVFCFNCLSMDNLANQLKLYIIIIFYDNQYTQRK